MGVVPVMINPRVKGRPRAADAHPVMVTVVGVVPVMIGRVVMVIVVGVVPVMIGRVVMVIVVGVVPVMIAHPVMVIVVGAVPAMIDINARMMTNAEVALAGYEAMAGHLLPKRVRRVGVALLVEAQHGSTKTRVSTNLN